jgi:ribosome maturation factor RimP
VSDPKATQPDVLHPTATATADRQPDAGIALTRGLTIGGGTGWTATQEKLFASIAPLIGPLGYELIHVEAQTHRQKTLRLFIEKTDWKAGGVGIEDCVNVSRALDEPLEKLSELEAVFAGPYELEVSSPGVDRPLRHSQDFSRFQGREIRLHTFRPLTPQESANEAFCKDHPKQKTFLGVLQGLDPEQSDRIVLEVKKDEGNSPDGRRKARKQGNKPSGNPSKKDREAGLPRITIPLELISKANLEPDFNISEDEEGIEL